MRRPSAAREVVAKDLKDLTFYVNRSIRYHSNRQGFYERFDVRINVANLVLGSWAVLSLLDQSNLKSIALWQGALIALLSFVNLSMRSAEKASKHSQFRQRYFDLLKKLKPIDASDPDVKQQLIACQESCFDIERDEPPTNSTLDLLAHNQQCKAQGESDSKIWAVPGWMRLTANFFDYDTVHIKTLEQVREEESAKVAARAAKKARK
ncbi:MAG: hypothetical protein EON59_05360 [Alphaproteobacteria bacterium]|nr:MAG: hypothetical protein EON59_05360 [Alphaproteobacteria bacterium]